MTGRKTLSEVRAELEAALGAGFVGEGEVAESLRRFLAAGGEEPGTPPQQPGDSTSVLPVSQPAPLPVAVERGH